jgi:lauroyl/myristoyl acyltransferase
MLYRLFRIASALAQAAPLPVAYRVAEVCGAAVYALWPGGRRRCIQNMRHVLGTNAPQHAVEHLARRSFANYAIYLIDFLRFTRVDAAEVDRRVLFDGWAPLDATRDDRGIVFVTMHYGNWDLGAAAVAQHGAPISVIADTFADPRLNDLVLDSRRALGMEIIPAERMGPSILRALKSRNIVAMLIDVPPANEGVEVEFFGDTIAVHGGPARIALRANAAVVAAVVPREDEHSDRVQPVIAPVPFTPSGDLERDVRDLTQAIMRALEPLVAKQPEQWYIFRSLWIADRAPVAASTAPARAH